MYEPAAMDAVGYMRGVHFHEPIVGWLFDQARALIAKGQRADAISLHELSQGQDAYQQIGGLAFLVDLVDRAPPPTHAPDYARVIFDLWIRRDLAVLCQEGAQAAAKDRTRPAFDVASDIRKRLDDLENAAAPEDAGMVAAPDVARQAIINMRELAISGKVRGRMTGLRCIDRRLGGLRPGAMIVIGGRPGMGKTSLARAIADGGARRNPEYLFPFLGIEMGPEEMMQRELSALTAEAGDGVEYRAMGSGSVTPMDLQLIESAQAQVPSNLILDDCHSLSVDDVRRKAWGLRRRGPIGAIVIDYLQLMRRPTANGRNEASVLGEMTRELKQIARQAETCVVLLSQLSRGVEYRDDKRPQLSDLRESGSIEQDADAVLFPYREFYYLSRNEPADHSKKTEWEMRCADTRNVMEVICAKKGQGRVGAARHAISGSRLLEKMDAMPRSVFAGLS